MMFHLQPRTNLLVPVHGVDEDGPARLVPQDALEHAPIEVGNPRPGDEQVEPRVGNVPQVLGPELQLGLVDPIQEIHVRDVGGEHGRRYKVEIFQQILHFLQTMRTPRFN